MEASKVVPRRLCQGLGWARSMLCWGLGLGRRLGAGRWRRPVGRQLEFARIALPGSVRAARGLREGAQARAESGLLIRHRQGFVASAQGWMPARGRTPKVQLNQGSG